MSIVAKSHAVQANMCLLQTYLIVDTICERGKYNTYGKYWIQAANMCLLQTGNLWPRVKVHMKMEYGLLRMCFPDMSLESWAKMALLDSKAQ